MANAIIKLRFFLFAAWLISPLACSLDDTPGARKAESKASVETEESKEGHYKLVKGMEVIIDRKIYRLCDDLLENLNSFPGAPPMVCERKFNPDLGFTAPDWKPIPKQDIDWEILKKIYFFEKNKFGREPNMAALEQGWAKEKEHLKSLAESQTILWAAEFDIDNEAGKEKVFKIYRSVCSPGIGPYQTQVTPTMFVVDQNGGLDMRYTGLFTKAAGVFFYKGHTYLSSWWEYSSNNDAGISINDTFIPRNKFGYSNNPVCKIHYDF